MVQQKGFKKNPTLIKIGKKWVNVEVWKRMHPGGAEPLERYAGQDATDPFVALHSKEALAQVEKMKSVDIPADVEKNCSEPSSLSLNFRAWREELEKDGYFDRAWHRDVFHITLMLFWCVSGYALAWSHPLVSMALLGLGMQQAGWIGHDYSHGRGKVSYWLGRFVAGLINAFSPEWWSAKHNTHHVHPNQIGVDTDIANDPILHLYIPATTDDDVWFRRHQHLYYHFAYAFLYMSWRWQSMCYAWNNNHRLEMVFMAINYMMLAMLPLHVAIGSVLVGGWLVGEIVTATHQSEDMLPGLSHDFVLNQFLTTRDVHMSSTFANYVWGGMQFQLIHHCFPTMPRYYYQEMVPKMFKFCADNKIEYRTAGALEIFQMNYNTMKKFAAKIEKID